VLRIIIVITLLTFSTHYIRCSLFPSPGWRLIQHMRNWPDATLNSRSRIAEIPDEKLFLESQHLTVLKQDEAQAWFAGVFLTLLIFIFYWDIYF